MIDGVVLHRLDQSEQVVGLGNEQPVGGQKVGDRRDHAMGFGDVGEHVGGGNHPGLAVAFQHLGDGGLVEVASQRLDAPFARHQSRLRRFDAQHPVPALQEIAEQRAVVRADVDHQIIGRERQHRHRLHIQVGEVLAQDAGRAGQVGIAKGKQHLGIDLEADLDMAAGRAADHLERERRLFDWHAADVGHGVDRRDEPDEQDRIEAVVPANLARGNGARGGHGVHTVFR